VLNHRCLGSVEGGSLVKRCFVRQPLPCVPDKKWREFLDFRGRRFSRGPGVSATFLCLSIFGSDVQLPCHHLLPNLVLRSGSHRCEGCLALKTTAYTQEKQLGISWQQCSAYRRRMQECSIRAFICCPPDRAGQDGFSREASNSPVCTAAPLADNTFRSMKMQTSATQATKEGRLAITLSMTMTRVSQRSIYCPST